MLDRISRIFRHRWFDQAALRRALPPAAMERLTQRVRASEARHTGEVRIYIEAGLPNSYLLRAGEMAALTRQRALTQFGKLRVWDTEQNNGVLVYLLLAERAIEIVADRGIERHMTPELWQTTLAHMREAFRAGRFEDGLNLAIDDLTAQLQQHFPRAPGDNDVNELPDAPVVGDAD